jgi:hypothetical protein
VGQAEVEVLRIESTVQSDLNQRECSSISSLEILNFPGVKTWSARADDLTETSPSYSAREYASSSRSGVVAISHIFSCQFPGERSGIK